MKRSLFLVWIRPAVVVAVVMGIAAMAAGSHTKLLNAFLVMSGANADEGSLPDLRGAAGWLNSPGLSSKSLHGKVVLVNFWTYFCINSLRELPYMKSWAAKYKDAGLIVIGVHAPEFGFEKERANVENAVSELKVTYPAAGTEDISRGVSAKGEAN
jgi:thiol-disulfide isomerase/thioredoxin